MPVAQVNGINLHYEERGAGDPLVWVSGTGIGGGVWDRWQTPHFEKRYRCITFDLRGTGSSDSPDEPYTLETFANDAIALVEHLDLGPAHFAGVSLGSAIIQEIALRRPELVRSAVLISTWSSTRREPHIRRWFEARLAMLRHAPIEVFRASAFWMSSPTIIDLEPQLQAEVEEFFARNSAAQPLHAYVGHFEADLGHDTMDRLHEIAAPTLVVYGDEDLITLPRYNEEVAARIPGSQAHVIPSAGHLAWVERGAEMNVVIERFLDGVEATSPTRSENRP
jgi:pimeloyl-ACP methyl ester carboxylesterase